MLTHHTYLVTFQSGQVWHIVAKSQGDAILTCSELNPGEPVSRVSRQTEW